MLFFDEILAGVALNDACNAVTDDTRRRQDAESRADFVNVAELAVFGQTIREGVFVPEI